MFLFYINIELEHRIWLEYFDNISYSMNQRVIGCISYVIFIESKEVFDSFVVLIQ